MKSSMVAGGEMRVAVKTLGTMCRAICGKHLGSGTLLPLIAGFVAVWQIRAVAPISAQAKTKVNSADGLTYVWIVPGTLRMGCSPHDSECKDLEKPLHSVTLTKGFWIAQTLVTQAAYKKVTATSPSKFKGDQLPVENVSWDDAKAYCVRLDMRLPTEAEWEYAARGGSTVARYAPLDQIAWYSANSMAITHDVAQKQANANGLYDMLGNVWEWVADWSGPYDASSAIDPTGPSQGTTRILRGASLVNDAPMIRVSYRRPVEPDHRGYYGFRCAGE
jgi:formylglycine-generating enzyme required for sulfatase activity